jgi:hypothetical protein
VTIENALDAGQVQRYAKDILYHIDQLINLLPSRSPSASEWIRQLLEGPSHLRRAMGMGDEQHDARIIRTMLESNSPAFKQWRDLMNTRLQIYLGGVEGLALGADITFLLARHRDKIRALREMLGNEPRTIPRRRRTLSSVVVAIDSGSLRDFWTGEADSDLWVVLKTLQESFAGPVVADSAVKLVSWVAKTITADNQFPGRHVSDRRHGWWAVRTLYQAATIGLYTDEDRVLARYLIRLLSEPTYASNPLAAYSSIVPAFHEELVTGWELINVAELLRGTWTAQLEPALILALQDREEYLVMQIVATGMPIDLRVATVYARGALTCLATTIPSLWGVDL